MVKICTVWLIARLCCCNAVCLSICHNDIAEFQEKYAKYGHTYCGRLIDSHIAYLGALTKEWEMYTGYSVNFFNETV